MTTKLTDKEREEFISKRVFEFEEYPEFHKENCETFNEQRIYEGEYGSKCSCGLTEAFIESLDVNHVESLLAKKVEEAEDAIFATLKEDKNHDKVVDKPSLVGALEFRREQYGITQSEMANRLGIQPSHYSEVITGKRRLSLIGRIKAYEIGVPADVLLQSI